MTRILLATAFFSLVGSWENAQSSSLQNGGCKAAFEDRLFARRDLAALYGYICGRVYRITKKLRGDQQLTEDEVNLAGAVDDALMRSPRFTGLAYRGLFPSPDALSWLPAQPGDRVVDKGFLSASMAREEALKFAAPDRSSKESWNGVLIEIESRTARIMPDTDQKEVIFRPGVTLELTSVSNIPGKRTFRFVEVDRVEPPVGRFMPAQPWTPLPSDFFFSQPMWRLPNRYVVLVKNLFGW